jgi:hypothetical protein
LLMQTLLGIQEWVVAKEVLKENFLLVDWNRETKQFDQEVREA